MHLWHRSSHAPARQASLLQHPSGNQANLLQQQASRPEGKFLGNCHEHGVTLENIGAQTKPRSALWSFGNISISPDRSSQNRFSAFNSVSAATHPELGLQSSSRNEGAQAGGAQSFYDRTVQELDDKGDDTPSNEAAGPRTAPSPSSVARIGLGSPAHRLDAVARSAFERTSGFDFGRVRIHSDQEAAASARTLGAAAFTVGEDIVFGAGRYRPDTDAGRRLLAHELVHTVQQRSASANAPRSLAVSRPDESLEREAASAGRALHEGRPASISRAGDAVIARQLDAGAPDAATGDAGGGAPGPGAGAPAPAPGAPPPVPAPGAPAPAPAAAPAPVITSLDVDNPTTSITYPVSSNLGAGGKKHHVTVATLSGPDTVIRANLTPAVGAADPSVAGLVWTVNGGVVPAGADILHTSVTRGAGKKEVTATLGASSASLTVWAVFAPVSGGPPAGAGADTGAAFRIAPNINLTARVVPASIVTDADRPALDGANTTPVPGGTNSCGGALAGGANRKWDISRQIRMRNIDPAGLLPAIHTATGGACLDAVGAVYPANNAEGNDDAGTGDETNDPYANAGTLTSTDQPARIYPHAVGADGDTIEQHIQFREFSRLEYNRTWWSISPFAPWRVHISVVRVGGKWQDNGSSFARDNAGF
jgi:hypothetical protein